MTGLWIYDDGCDPLYKYYRDSLDDHPSRVRKILLRWWDAAELYLDNEFRQEFSLHPYARVWELHLANLLLENGKHLIPKSEYATRDGGPDFLVQDEYGKIWIEATALKCGNEDKPDSVPEIKRAEIVMLSKDSVERKEPIAHQVPVDSIELRITTAMSSKIGQLHKYLKKGIVAKDDRVLIAINTGRVPYRMQQDRGTPLCVLYPVGSLQYAFNRNGNGGEASYQFRTCIQKTSGSTVNTDYFINPENQNITGVLWSTFNMGSYFFPSSTLCYFPNPCATVSMENRWLNWAYEWNYKVDGEMIEINKVTYSEDDQESL